MNQNTFVNKIVKIHYFLKKASKIIFVVKLRVCLAVIFESVLTLKNTFKCF